MESVPEPPATAGIDRLLAAMRPRLHRYCARMVGSVIDGEDVLQEVCEVMDLSLPAVKAALHRGRAQLREFANEPEEVPQPKLSDADRKRLSTYVTHFNARDFDAIRAMIADDVRLELVNKTRMSGKAEVSRYFGNYSKISDWHLVPGSVEGRPAILVVDPDATGAGPQYLIL